MSTKNLLAKLAVPTVSKKDAKLATKKTGIVDSETAKTNIEKPTQNVGFGSHPADRLSLDHNQHFMADFKAPAVAMYVASDQTKPVGEGGSDDHLKRITTLAEERQPTKKQLDAIAMKEFKATESADRAAKVARMKANVERTEIRKGNDIFGLGVTMPEIDNVEMLDRYQFEFLTAIANGRLKQRMGDMIDNGDAMPEAPTE